MIILLDRIFEFSLLGKVCRYGVCGEGSEPNVYDYTGRMLGSQGIQKSLFCFIKKKIVLKFFIQLNVVRVERFV